MEIKVGNIYRPNKNSGSDFTERMKLEIDGSDIRVLKLTGRSGGYGFGCVLSFEVLATGKVYTADQGKYDDYWCFFTEDDFKNHFELVTDFDAVNCVVRTTYEGEMYYHEPMNIVQARALAISQKENGAPGVEVHILKIAEEVVQTIVTRAV